PARGNEAEQLGPEALVERLAVHSQPPELTGPQPGDAPAAGRVGQHEVGHLLAALDLRVRAAEPCHHPRALPGTLDRVVSEEAALDPAAGFFVLAVELLPVRLQRRRPGVDVLLEP